MAVSQNKESCNSCRFYSAEDRMGLCKRFPSYVHHSNNDWCGEWSMSDSEALAQFVQIATQPVVLSEPKKPRGRPKKC
jgi:hypothetical protein